MAHNGKTTNSSGWNAVFSWIKYALSGKRDETKAVSQSSVSASALVSINARLEALEKLTAARSGEDSQGLSAFKTLQSAKSSPSASSTSLAFIDTIAQNENGEIAATKKTVQNGTTAQKGVVQLEDSYSSTSTTKAATPNAVKSAYDLANGKYTLPSGGIPKADLASAVQTSLGKADTALQSHQDISGKLDKTGDASNATSTFTKASSDTSSMTSGGKLSALFTAISNIFASLKALAFKDSVTDSDISGTISNSHIASADTWNGKQDALPMSGSSYNINISGNAATATSAKATSDSNSTSQKAVAVSVEGISHSSGSSRTVIDGGNVSATGTMSASVVNATSSWFTDNLLIANDGENPTGNYVDFSKNGIECHNNAAFTGPLVGNASTATGVQDYGNVANTIKIGYAGQSLTSATHLAAFSSDGKFIKDIHVTNVLVGKATADANGNNIVNYYQRKIAYSQSTIDYTVSVAAGETKSIGDRSTSQGGFAYTETGFDTSTLIDVEFDVEYTCPSGGSAIRYMLCYNNSDNALIDGQTVTRYVYSPGTVFDRVHLSKMAPAAGSHLYLRILNGTGVTLQFTVRDIKLRLFKNPTNAVTSM